MTTFWADYTLRTIEATECWKETTIVDSVRTGWFSRSRMQGEKKFEYLSRAECEELAKPPYMTRDGQELVAITQRLRATTNNVQPGTGVFDWGEVKNTNYYLSAIEMTVNVHDQTIQPVGAVPMSCGCRIL